MAQSPDQEHSGRRLERGGLAKGNPADSTKIEIGKPHPTDEPLSIAADLTKPLGAGRYLVVWRTAGDDGHAVRGKFAFTVGK